MALPAGHYCLLPATFHPDLEAEFLVRLWVDSRWDCDLERRSARRVGDYQVRARTEYIRSYTPA